VLKYSIMFGVLLLCCVAVAVHGCSTDLPWYVRQPPPSYQMLAAKIKFSSHVLFGRSVRKVNGAEYPFDGIDGVFTLEFDVLCSYKGGRVPQTVYIAGMGNTNGALPGCPSVEMPTTEYSVMFLKQTRMPSVFEVEFASIDSDDSDIMLDDLTVMCGLEQHEETAADECADVYPLSEDDGCVTFTAASTIPPVSTGSPVTVMHGSDDERNVANGHISSINALITATMFWFWLC